MSELSRFSVLLTEALFLHLLVFFIQVYFHFLNVQTNGCVKDTALLSGLTQARIYDLLKKGPYVFQK
ncbi:MAG: hypothetical protein K9K64_03045 [Desulfohalobiaceae bacterium]|nr:hypothetical protein [Desulfohalobiaceae bacterium]